MKKEPDPLCFFCLLFISPSIFKAVFLETIAGLMPLKKYLHRYPDPSPSPMLFDG
jgi:hypothetical protein